jgi:hypothetical protein
LFKFLWPRFAPHHVGEVAEEDSLEKIENLFYPNVEVLDNDAENESPEDEKDDAADGHGV